MRPPSLTSTGWQRNSPVGTPPFALPEAAAADSWARGYHFALAREVEARVGRAHTRLREAQLAADDVRALDEREHL
jgi:hypothetical protein